MPHYGEMLGDIRFRRSERGYQLGDGFFFISQGV
jgi:hypothetical protein